MMCTWQSRQTGPQDPHIDNLRLQDGDHACSVASSETSVLYLQVPEVRSQPKVPRNNANSTVETRQILSDSIE